MQFRRSLLHVGLGALAVAGIALTSSSCVVKTAGSVACGAETRTSVDCSSEVSYQGYKADGGFGILSLASGKANIEEVALRRVSEATERYITMHTRLCKDYNACALDKDRYNVESREIRDKLEKVPVLVDKVKSASEQERPVAIDALYRHTVPDAERLEEVALRIAMAADMPPEAGGKRITVLPGMPLPTEARVWFTVEVIPTAYVYIFQKNTAGEVTVLFPDERIGTKNPLTGEQPTRIPNASLKFRLNEKDIGREFVYFAASRKPLDSLDAALARVRQGKVTTVKDDPLLTSIAAAANAPKTRECRGLELDCTRGLELDVTGGFGQGSSVGAVTDPGDSMVVYSFSFEHTTLAGFRSANEAYVPVSKTRSSVMIERRTRSSVMIE